MRNSQMVMLNAINLNIYPSIRTHTHTHTYTHTYTYTHTHTHTHTHTQTYSQTLTLTHTHTHKVTQCEYTNKTNQNKIDITDTSHT